MGYALDVEVDADILERRQQHLEDEGLVDGKRAAKHIAVARGMVIRVDLRENFVPVSQIVEDRIVGVRCRRAGEDGFEERCEFAIGRRAIAVGRDVIGDALREAL